jgi:hypothetical protein
MASWKNIDPDAIPEAGDYADYRADLLNEGYWTLPQLNDAIGNQVNGRTWRQIGQELNDYCKNATQGGAFVVFQAESVGGNERGTDSSSVTVGTADVVKIVTTDQFGGMFSVDVDSDNPSDAFSTIVVKDSSNNIVLSLDTEDALFIAATDTWYWVGVGFEFVLGETYLVIVTL